MKEYDLIIIGGGAAGFSAAMKANVLNAKTLMINNAAIGLGGTCANVGCLPTKYLLYLSNKISEIVANKLPGVSSSTTFDFKTIMTEKDHLVENFRIEKYEKVLQNLRNVDFVEGNAHFISRNKVQIKDQIYSSKKFIISTGSSTFIPSIPGLKQIDYLTHIGALQLKSLPKSMIVIGGGALGLEFSQLFSRFGTKICILDFAEKIVPREEPELSNLLHQYLQEEGIQIYTHAEIKQILQENNMKIVKTTVNGSEKKFRAEKLLIATGRRANTSDLGLEKLNIKINPKNEIITNKEMQVAENLWVAGDVTGEPMLETVAAREGMIAAHNALSLEKKYMDYRIVPHAIFTDPQLASVGLTDAQAVAKGFNCRCSTIPMELVPKAKAINDTRGAIKMVINNDSQEILGIHILALEAAELIHEGTMIIKNRMTIDSVIDTLHIFPTLSEAIKIAAQSFRRDVSKMTCCAE